MKIFYVVLLVIFSIPMKSQVSFGVIYGKTKPINYLESNLDQLQNFNGTVTIDAQKSYFANRTLFQKNINAQYGISAMYQKHRNFYTIELTGNVLGQIYSLIEDKGNDNYSESINITASRAFTRINFQYGREIWKDKKDKISIIPTIAIGFMPYRNNSGGKEVSKYNGDTLSRLVELNNNRGLNTQITMGLSAKFYLNPRFDLMFSTTYTHGFADKYRYTYMKNFPGHGTLFFDISNKARFYNANITFLYKLKKNTKVANKSIGKGDWSIGIISGKTFGKNKIDDNFNTLPNVDGKISKSSKTKPFSTQNSGFQYGISLNYKLDKNNFTLELTSNDANAYYNLNSKYKGTDSSFNSSVGFARYRRINFQYGYAVLESRSKRFFLIPTIGVAILPYYNRFEHTGDENYESGIQEYSIVGKNKRALNTSLVFGLSAKLKLNQRFALKGNITYTHGFSEQYRLYFYKSYGTDGTLLFDISNKARFYNANLSLLYTFQKEKPAKKAIENPFNLEE